MIRIVIERGKADGIIYAFSVKGHADFAKHGRDIVCAGVSAVTVGTVNAIEAVVGVALQCEMKDGLLQAVVPADITGEQLSQVQLLLESMVVMLDTIKTSYSDYVAIREIEASCEEGGRQKC